MRNDPFQNGISHLPVRNFKKLICRWENQNQILKCHVKMVILRKFVTIRWVHKLRFCSVERSSALMLSSHCASFASWNHFSVRKLMKFQDNKDRNISNFAVRGRFPYGKTSQCELNIIWNLRSTLSINLSTEKGVPPSPPRCRIHPSQRYGVAKFLHNDLVIILHPKIKKDFSK